MASAEYPDVYEDVIVQDTYDVDLRDPDGVSLGGIILYLHPVPATGQVNLTFWIQSGDEDTDIDKIVVGTDSGVALTDASVDLSQNETGGEGDWEVSGNTSEIIYTAVTDSNGADDDALDKNENLTIVVTMDLTGDTGLFDISFSLKNAKTVGNESKVSKEYTFYFIALDQGDMFLQTRLNYGSEKLKPYLLVTGTGVSFGENDQGTFQRNFPDAYDVYRSTTDMVYIFFADEADMVTGLTYIAVNPNTGSQIELRMNVAMFTAQTIGTKSVVLVESPSPGLNSPSWIPNGGEFVFLYGDHLHGPLNPSHYIDDDDDDNDGYPDLVEIEAGSDPLDSTSIPTGNGNNGTTPDGDGDDMSMIIIVSLIVIVLGIVLGILLVKMGIIGGVRPKPKKVKKKPKKKKAEEEVKWEKPRQRKKRERSEKAVPKKAAATRSGKAKPKKAAPVRSEEAEEEEEVEEESEPEAAEEAEVAEETEIEEEEEVVEEEDDDDFDFDDDLDLDELEAELADLEDKTDDLDEEDLEADLDDDDLVAELDDDPGEKSLEKELDDDLDDLDLDELENELKDI